MHDNLKDNHKIYVELPMESMRIHHKGPIALLFFPMSLLWLSNIVHCDEGATSKWANWDPSRKIKVGDYGMIINETGEFDWEGNIYSTHFQEQIKSSQEAKDDNFIAKSWGITATKPAPLVKRSAVPGAVTVALKLDLQFASNKPEAVLVMHKPAYSSLSNDERIIRLIKSVMLKATGPVALGIDTGGTASLAWSSEAAYGISREGCDPTAKYMSLYRLKKPRPRLREWFFGQRGNEIHNNLLNSLEDVDPPWNPLDEEGEE
ncbi:hypothetical protein EDD22DRAFT_947554 [Suillus occidentalis]|nr:hypothetical protein EDD22DRAFT_947554 [Suillus occidentalis]